MGEELTNFDSGDFTTNYGFTNLKMERKYLYTSVIAVMLINEQTPVLLYGYGGFDIAILRKAKSYLAWMNQGGVVACPTCIGSEYGVAGMKQYVIQQTKCL